VKSAVDPRKIFRKGTTVIGWRTQGSKTISPCGRNDENYELCVFAPWRENSPNLQPPSAMVILREEELYREM
jgi:hypothetical protein